MTRSGEHAPGRQDPAAGVAAGHHFLLGHGLAVQRLRELGPELQLGITLNFTVADPVDPESDADVNAARIIDGQQNRFFVDPIIRGEYPSDVLEDLAGTTRRNALSRTVRRCTARLLRRVSCDPRPTTPPR